MNEFEKRFRQLDWGLILLIMMLAVYSCTAIAAAVHGNGKSIPSHVLLKQILFETLGLLTMLMTSTIDYTVYKKVIFPLYLLSIILLAGVFMMAPVNGAHSWIPLGPLSFQPSEIAKTTMILLLALFLEQIEKSRYVLKKYALLGATVLLPFSLTLKEPALGQALVMIVITASMFVFHTKKTVYVVSSISAAFLIYLCMIQFPNQTIQWIRTLIRHHVLKTYQANRIIDWLNPNLHAFSSGYAIKQTLTAIGSGKILGQGIFHGTKTNGNWIPNQWTDYIFSAIGEETGFIGASLLLLLFLLLLYRLIRILQSCKDAFGQYIVIGFMGMFGFQIFENIGMNIDLMPITGITLPFISYGGSSLITNYIALGICINIYIKSSELSLQEFIPNPGNL